MITMIENIMAVLSENPIHGWAMIIGLSVVAGLIVWVSAIDIKKHRITFWKIGLASSFTILAPLLVAFTSNSGLLPLYLLGSIVLWIFLLWMNIRFNKDRFIGKADVDLLSALFSGCVGFSAWVFTTVDPTIAMIRVTAVWYTLFMYLFIGSAIYVVLFVIRFAYIAVVKKENFLTIVKSTKVAVVPMLAPAAIMVPYMIMLA